MELDEIDRKILEVLKKDARTPFTDVGRSLGVSDATVHLRVRRLVDNGFIKKFTIIPDEERLGPRINGFLLINVVPGHLEIVTKELLNVENVSEVYEVYAPNDLMVKITAENLEELRNIVQKIRQIPDISQTNLITGLKKWKK